MAFPLIFPCLLCLSFSSVVLLFPFWPVFTHSPCPSYALAMSFLASSSSFYSVCTLLFSLKPPHGQTSGLLFLFSKYLILFMVVFLWTFAPYPVTSPSRSRPHLARHMVFFPFLIHSPPFHDGHFWTCLFSFQCYLPSVSFVSLFLPLLYRSHFGLSSHILPVLLMLSLCPSWLLTVPSQCSNSPMISNCCCIRHTASPFDPFLRWSLLLLLLDLPAFTHCS